MLSSLVDEMQYDPTKVDELGEPDQDVLVGWGGCRDPEARANEGLCLQIFNLLQEGLEPHSCANAPCPNFFVRQYGGAEPAALNTRDANPQVIGPNPISGTHMIVTRP